MRHAVVVVAVTLALSSVARAQDRKKVKLAEDEFKTYWSLRLAKRVAAKRMELATLGSQREAIEKARAKAFADAGWTDAKFEGMDSAVRSVVRLVEQARKGGEDGEDAKLTLAEYDRTTIATVEAHLAELTDSSSEQKKVDELAREQESREAANAPPKKESKDPKGGTPAKAARGEDLDEKFLEGTWVQDVDLTVERMAQNVNEAFRTDFKERMLGALKMQPLPRHVFGPGAAYESRMELPGGKVTAYKGSYRLDGDKVHVTYDPALGKPEATWEVAREGELLLVGKKKAPMVYRRLEK